jgi:hypothetical protein
MNKYYHYLGKSNINVEPLVKYLHDSIIPLFNDNEYRNGICALRTKQSVEHGYPPVFLDANWKPGKHIMSSKDFWCLPFKYTSNTAMFVLGGNKLSTDFPEIFKLQNADPWTDKLKRYIDTPQIIITNGDSSKHSDVGGRHCSINTFLYNTDKSITEFWSETEKAGEIIYNAGDAYLLNIRQLHQIKQSSNGIRCVLSFGYNIPFEKAKEILYEQNTQ